MIVRLNHIFRCTAVVIATERQDGAFLYHIAVENKSASRYTAVRLIQDGFPEVAGNEKVDFNPMVNDPSPEHIDAQIAVAKEAQKEQTRKWSFFFCLADSRAERIGGA